MTAEELKELFKDIDKGQREIAFEIIEEMVMFRDRIKQLEKLPYLRVNKNNPEKQQMTPAAKIIKEYSQAVDNKRKTLLMILYRNTTSDADELLKKLAEFE
jgi:hypothetical protein